MLFVDLAVRASVILFAAIVATLALRQAAAATRHHVWTLAVVCVLALPAAMLALPEWKILPGGGRGVAQPFRAAFGDGRAKALPHIDSLAQGDGRGNVPPHLEGVAQPFGAAYGDGRVEALPYIDSASFTVEQFAWSVWSLVSCALLVRIASGIAAVRRLARYARPADARWRNLLDQVVATAGVRRRVRLLVSGDVAMPMTWGGTRPIVLLPLDASGWSDDRARVVLLHEVSHILRADWLTHALGRLLLACHWFNPLAWIAVRAMTREREAACDDYVLAQGARPTEYAQHLLDLASAGHPGAAWPIALAMARRSELEGRLLSILTPHRRETGRFAVRVSAVAAAATTVAVAIAAPAGPTGAHQSSSIQVVGSASVDSQQPVGQQREGQQRVGQQTVPPPSTAPRANTRTEDDRPEREAVNALAGALEDPSRDVRESAALGLAMSHDQDAIQPLIRALEDPDADVREKAALGLGFRSESSVVDPLIAALGDPSAQVREKAAIGLGLRRLPHVVDALLEAASDPDSQVREKVVIALGLSGDKRATAAIVAATKDPDPQVREKAVTALTMLTSDSGVQDAIRGALGAIFGSETRR